MEPDTQYRVMEETKIEKIIIEDNLSYMNALDSLSKISVQFFEVAYI